MTDMFWSAYVPFIYSYVQIFFKHILYNFMMCHYSLQSHFDLDKERYAFLRNVSNLQFQYRGIHRRLYEELLVHSLTRAEGRQTYDNGCITLA